jgi:NAD(P)H-hydrate epimerase
VPRELVNFINLATPEVITLPFDNINQIKPDVIAIGPGLGTSHQVKRLLAQILDHPIPIVIDADALNILAQDLNLLAKKSVQVKENIILTPHPGELARLIKQDIAFIQKNRIAVAKKTAQELGCILVLKGDKTVITHPSGKTLVNPTGNPGMASGGMGDVLTGLIAGLAAQKITPWQAAVLGVYIHGLAGDLAAKDKGEPSLIASDLVEQLPYALQKIS